MDSRKLKYFLEVADAGTFTKAAERLFVAQPAVSKTIQKLEEDLQLTLFDRGEKKAVLTPEGRVLMKHAHLILGKLEDAAREMNELHGLERGEITIGLPSMFEIAYFPPMLKQFRSVYPGLKINVVEEGTVEIRHLIEQKKVDLGVIAYNPQEQELDVSLLLTDELVACFPASHPLAGRSSITLTEFLHEELILFREGYFQRQLLEEASEAAGLPLNITFSTNQLALINRLVVDGLGITLFLRMVAAGDPRLVPVSLDPPVTVTLGIGRRKNTYLSKASRIFLEFLQNYVIEHSHSK